MELLFYCYFILRLFYFGVRDFMSFFFSSVIIVRKNECYGIDMFFDRFDFCGGMLGVVVLFC